MSAPVLSPARTLAEFDHELRLLLAEVRERAVDADRDGTLLRGDVAALQALGFGALRLPIERGGFGATFAEVIERLVLIAAADSNLAHVYRGHVAFVEGLLADERGGGHVDLWAERIARGDLVGNAQSERQETADITTVLERSGDEITITGRKYYTTGSIYADWIHLSALDGERRVGVTVWAHDQGVVSYDDWDGFGQRLTGTGTTTFDAVAVDPADIVVAGEKPAAGDHLAAVFQLVLLAVVAGVGRALVRDAVDYVRPRRRIFGRPGEAPPRDDALVQQIVGSVSAAAAAAERLVLSGARDVAAALESHRAGDEDAMNDLLLDVFRLQQVVAPLVLDAATELFEVGGASAVGRGLALDRHWRNVRTIHSHNPAVQRRRAVGDFELNGTRPAWKPAVTTEAEEARP